MKYYYSHGGNNYVVTADGYRISFGFKSGEVFMIGYSDKTRISPSNLIDRERAGLGLATRLGRELAR